MKPTSERSLGPAGWAVYLGCSWTWCIGMFLPALLIRDLGFWGFVVFAVPNVVGAGAMGWVLRSPETSRKLVEDHKAAAVMFSRVTLLFHYFWIAWLVSWAIDTLSLPFWNWFGIVVASLGTIAIFGTHISAFIIWFISAGLLVSIAFTDGIEPSAAEFLRQRPFNLDVLWLLPASVFGFMFCPYLDLTFHRARQACEKPSSSRFAFGMGFGVFFFSMIILTVLYAGPIAVLTDRDSDAGIKIATWLAVLLAVHLGLQALFTTQVHETEVHKERAPTDGPYGWFSVFAAFAVVFGMVSGQSPNSPWLIVEALNMTGGEIAYRLFLTFYAPMSGSTSSMSANARSAGAQPGACA